MEVPIRMRSERPSLSTGEVFYTNFPKKGTILKGKEVSLEEYLASLRQKFTSVKVDESLATDVDGHQIRSSVAIFIGEKIQNTQS